jgi:two-component system phosphate regulon response regulator PhoB
MKPEKPEVLIFDEDEEMRDLLLNQLRSPDYTLTGASHYKQVLEAIQTRSISLLITDVKIPEISFSEFLKKIRAFKSEAELTVLALSPPTRLGEASLFMKNLVNDFLMKPFDRLALVSKIKTLLKVKFPDLEKALERPGRLTFKDLVLDVDSFDVFSKGERVKLTPNEFKLLRALLENPRNILSRERLINLVQGVGVAVIDRAVDTHIFSLRKKLGKVGEFIETVRGEGYRLG